MPRKAVCFMALLGALSASLRAGITIEASNLTPEVNETVVLTVIITGATEQLVLGQLPELEGVTIRPTGSGTRLRTLDGKVRIEDYLVVEVTTHRAGRLELTGIAVAAGADTWEAPAVKLTVGHPPAAPPTTETFAGRSAPKMRIVVEATPRESYIGEPVRVDYTLLAQGPVLRCVPALPLEFPGFSAQLLNLLGGHTQQRIEGELYHSWPLSRHLLTAASPGHKLLPARPFRVAYRDGEKLGAEFTVDAPQLSLEILEPPGTHQPAAYEGLVGDYLLTASLEPASVAPHQYATLKILLSGRGQPYGGHPHLQLPAGLELKSPRVNDQPAPPGESRREWTFPVLAVQPGEYRLGPVTLSAFSPARSEYEILSTAPLALKVRERTAGGAEPDGWTTRFGALQALAKPRALLWLSALLLLLWLLRGPAVILLRSPAALALRRRPPAQSSPEQWALWLRVAMNPYLPAALRHAPLSAQAAHLSGSKGASIVRQLEHARFNAAPLPAAPDLTRLVAGLRWRKWRQERI
jgi:hypothetical protein